MNLRFKSIYFLVAWSFGVFTAKGQQVFTSLDTLLSYSAQKSTSIKTGDIKFTQAEKAKLAAIAGIVDLTGNISLHVTDNTRLPVSLFPAEAFGGAPGTYREVQTGIQYTNNFSQYVEVKLYNPSGWQNLKLAKINIDVTSIDNKRNKKDLYDNIAATYYNILTLQEQLSATQENVTISDSLYQIVKNKFEVGLARQQEVNDAQVNYISTKESVTQIEYLLQQQYIALKMLCDIPQDEDISIQQNISYESKMVVPVIVMNKLDLLSSQLKEQSAFTTYRQQKLNLNPTFSAFVSNSYQQFSSEFSLFNNNVKWINSNYIGLKMVWQIPSANTITQISKSKYDYLLAQQNTEHALLQSNLQNQQLRVDFEKAQSQLITNKRIYDLRTDTYNKNLENYKQGVLSLDQLLTSYNAMVNSDYNHISSAVSVMLAQSKIKINNEIQ